MTASTYNLSELNWRWEIRHVVHDLHVCVDLIRQRYRAAISEMYLAKQTSRITVPLDPAMFAIAAVWRV